MRLHDSTIESRPDKARELTLSERVAWVNAYERSLVQDDGSVVLEIKVYPIEDLTNLPTSSQSRRLLPSMWRAMKNRPRPVRRVSRRQV